MIADCMVETAAPDVLIDRCSLRSGGNITQMEGFSGFNIMQLRDDGGSSSSVRGILKGVRFYLLRSGGGDSTGGDNSVWFWILQGGSRRDRSCV